MANQLLLEYKPEPELKFQLTTDYGNPNRMKIMRAQMLLILAIACAVSDDPRTEKLLDDLAS